MGFRERMLYNLRRHQWFEWSSMNRQTILRTVLAAILLAAWISWVFPFFIQMLQMPESWLARKLFACEFPPSPNEDGTLAHAWVLGPLVFFLNTITLLPLALALLFSFPSSPWWKGSFSSRRTMSFGKAHGASQALKRVEERRHTLSKRRVKLQTSRSSRKRVKKSAAS